jgi:hypothetical protein
MKANTETLSRLLVGQLRQGAAGRAGLGALLREVEGRYPGELQRMTNAVVRDLTPVSRA